VRPLLQVLQARYAFHFQGLAGSGEAEPDDQYWSGYFHSAWTAYAQEYGTYPDAAALAAYVHERDSITGSGGQPITGDDLAGFVASFQEQNSAGTQPSSEETAADSGGHGDDEARPQETASEAVPAGVGAQPAKAKRTPRVNAALEETAPGPEELVGERPALTTVDRYYLAWAGYQSEHGGEPTAKQLSAYLAKKGMHGRGGQPVSPANLRRYFLPSRVYSVWAEHRMDHEQPGADAVAQECAARGISAQYNKPITTDYITDNAVDFERRWHALNRHPADAQQ
jgi:hypothetical protein